MRSSDAFVPRWLDERDHGWVQSLAEDYDRHVGSPRRELDSCLRTVSPDVPPRRIALVRRVLDRLHAPAAGRRAVGPGLRARVFAAAASTWSRERALELVAAETGVPVTELGELLFADLSSERRLPPARERLATPDLCRRANQVLVEGLLAGARRVTVFLLGDPRPLVRRARRLGLMGVLTGPDANGWFAHTLLGPASMSTGRPTCARGLRGLLPDVTGRPGVRLAVEIGARGARMLRVDETAPLPRGPSPITSGEHALLGAVPHAGPGWSLDRDPVAVRACGELFVPDFAVITALTSERLMVEVIDRWSLAWLRDRVTRLTADARDVELWVHWNGRDELPDGDRVVTFRDERELRARLDEMMAHASLVTDVA